MLSATAAHERARTKRSSRYATPFGVRFGGVRIGRFTSARVRCPRWTGRGQGATRRRERAGEHEPVSPAGDRDAAGRRGIRQSRDARTMPFSASAGDFSGVFQRKGQSRDERPHIDVPRLWHIVRLYRK